MKLENKRDKKKNILIVRITSKEQFNNKWRQMYIILNTSTVMLLLIRKTPAGQERPRAHWPQTLAKHRSNRALWGYKANTSAWKGM